MSGIGKAALQNAVATETMIAGMARMETSGARTGAALEQLGQKSTMLSGAWRDLGNMGHRLELMFAGVAGAIGAEAVIEYANAWTRVPCSISATENEYGVVLKPASELNLLRTRILRAPGLLS